MRVNQFYNSAKTSINTVPSVFKKYEFKKGSSVLDYGGGKYNTAKEYMERAVGVKFYIYDPYNRNEELNTKVLIAGQSKGGFDNITCNNVLNVILEDEVILYILNHMKNLHNGVGNIYIQVYEGNRSGVGQATTRGYQRNQKAVEYEEVIKKVFHDRKVQRKGNIFEVS